MSETTPPLSSPIYISTSNTPSSPIAGGQFLSEDTAVARALNVAEILESILIYVAATPFDEHARDVLGTMYSAGTDPLIDTWASCRSVCRFWRATVDHSIAIARQIWRAPFEVVSTMCPLGDYHLENPGVIPEVFNVWHKPLINYPYVAWLERQLSRCFDPSRCISTSRNPFRHVFEKDNFPKSYFTNPPTTSVWLQLKLHNEFNPGLRRPRNTDSTLASLATCPPGYCEFNEDPREDGDCVYALMGLGREAHVRDWLKGLRVGIARNFVYQEFGVDGYTVETYSWTNAGQLWFERPEDLGCYKIGHGLPSLYTRFQLR
ncbi:hypothetical protein ABW19_dt0204299 [Dactylella cylindrospora]|nr:hypothetical protein ABW19_dt0204299 [Dactylella cylindrospora]